MNGPATSENLPGMPESAAAGRHDAFISYHNKSSLAVARYLQRQLERIARRSVGDSAIRLFRDETNLTFSDLDETLKHELQGSRRLLVILHRDTPQSVWVDEEIRYWLDNGGAPERLTLIRADPELDLTWDREKREFQNENQLPAALRGVFRTEPLWADLSHRSLGRVSGDTDELARLCATLLERDPNEVLQRERREQKKRERRRTLALIAVTIIAVIALIASVLAVVNAREAARQRDEAEGQAEAAQALLMTGTRPDRAIVSAIRASVKSGGSTVRTAMLSVLNDSQGLASLLPMSRHLSGRSPDHIGADESGTRVVGARNTGSGGAELTVWDVRTGAVVAGGAVEDEIEGSLTLVGSDHLAFCSDDGPQVARFTDTGVEVIHEIESDDCHVSPFRGGANMVGRGEGGVRGAVTTPDGHVAEISDLAYLQGHPSADRVLVMDHDEAYRSMSNDGGSLPMTALNRFDPDAILQVSDLGEVVARRGGKWIRTSMLDPGQFSPLKADKDAVAAARLPDKRSSDSVIWLNSKGELAWSLDKQTVAILDPSKHDPHESVIWVSEDGKAAAVAFDRDGDSAKLAVVQLNLDVRPPQITRVKGTHEILGTRHELEFAMQPGSPGLVLRVEEGILLVRGDQIRKLRGTATVDLREMSVLNQSPEGTTLFDLDDRFRDGLVLDRRGDAKASAFSGDGQLVAIARPAGPVAVYSTQGSSVSDALVETIGGTHIPLVTGLGGIQIQEDNGNILRTVGDGDAEVIYSSSDEALPRLRFARPDGSALIADFQSPTDNLYETEHDWREVRVDGEATSIKDKCGDWAKYWPGPNFRHDLDDAEAQRLLGGQSDVGVDCHTEEIVAPPEYNIMDYQMDQERGRIVSYGWSEDDHAVKVTSWRRGDQGSLRTTELPIEGQEARVALDDSGTLAATWLNSDTILNLSRLDGDQWLDELQLMPTLGEIHGVSLLPDENALVVVGKNSELELYDLTSGRQILHHEPVEVELGDPLTGESLELEAQVIHTNRVADYLIIRVILGGPDAGVWQRTAALFRVPFDVGVLRERLCSMSPTTEGCLADG